MERGKERSKAHLHSVEGLLLFLPVLHVEGVEDAFIISFNALESIDVTRKGNLWLVD